MCHCPSLFRHRPKLCWGASRATGLAVRLGHLMAAGGERGRWLDDALQRGTART
jgi:hypothetical protein